MRRQHVLHSCATLWHVSRPLLDRWIAGSLSSLKAKNKPGTTEVKIIYAHLQADNAYHTRFLVQSRTNKFYNLHTFRLTKITLSHYKSCSVACFLSSVYHKSGKSSLLNFRLLSMNFCSLFHISVFRSVSRFTCARPLSYRVWRHPLQGKFQS